jgi:hypothetical protein
MEAGPATASIELGIGFEQGLLTADTTINAIVISIDITARERGLGSGLASDKKLFFGQLLSPLRVGFNQFVRHGVAQ